MRRSAAGFVNHRVRELYLELLLLTGELDGMRTTTSVDARKHSSPHFYIRLDCEANTNTNTGGGATEGDAGAAADNNVTFPETALAVMAAVGGEVLANRPPDSSEGRPAHQHRRHREHGRTYRIEREHCPRLDPFYPPNWRNNATLTSASPPLQPSAPSVAADPTATATATATAHHISFESHYRAEVQAGFYQCALLSPGGPEWKRALAKGRFQLRKLHEMVYMKKYRAMRKRYDWAAQLSTDDLLAAYTDSKDGGGGGRGGNDGNTSPSSDGGGSTSTGGGGESAVHARVRTAQMGLGNRDSYGYKEEG